jgi:hypothetical protein
MRDFFRKQAKPSEKIRVVGISPRRAAAPAFFVLRCFQWDDGSLLRSPEGARVDSPGQRPAAIELSRYLPDSTCSELAVFAREKTMFSTEIRLNVSGFGAGSVR